MTIEEQIEELLTHLPLELQVKYLENIATKIRKANLVRIGKLVQETAYKYPKTKESHERIIYNPRKV